MWIACCLLMPLSRVEARLAVDAAGELYISSKRDGRIRQIVGSVR